MTKSSSKIVYGRPDWPLWKVVVAALIVYGPFSLLLLIIPPFLDSNGIIIVITFIVLGTSFLIWGHFSINPLAHILGNFVLTLEFLAIAARSFSAAIPITWHLLLPLYIGFLLAWAFPLLSRRISSRVASEMMAPETRLGRIAMTLVLALGPSAGVIGASIGMFSSRVGERNTAWLALALLASVLAIGWGFHNSYDLAKKYHHTYKGTLVKE